VKPTPMAILFSTLLTSLVGFNAHANSATLQNEVLIRLNRPQNTISQSVHSLSRIARDTGFETLASQFNEELSGSLEVKGRAENLLFKSRSIQIVNAEEGLVRLTLPFQISAEEVMREFESHPEVIQTSKNHLYRPALRLVAKEAASESDFDSRALSRYLPAVLQVGQTSLASPSIPNVLLPSPQTPGSDALLAQDWAMQAIGIGLNQWGAIQGRAHITTAVIDTGVDYNHEDLINGMWRMPGSAATVGFDFAHNNARPYDLRVFDVEGCLKDPLCSSGLDQRKYLVNPGHGTHCAGHVAAVAGNSVGIRGVAAGSRIMALKFFFDVGHENAGQGSDVGAIQSIDYAIKNGAKIINASWGGNGPREEAEKSELKAALVRAQKAGVLVVIAAGNDGRDNDTDETPNWPASYELDNIITVAATDSNSDLASFSAYGQRTVHIGAPGVKILSTIAGGGYNDIVASFKDRHGNTQTMDWDGTSMAAPMVAGAAAAVWSKFPNLNYRQVREKILKSARKVASLEGRVATGGVLDVGAALRD
jgi:thermitase